MFGPSIVWVFVIGDLKWWTASRWGFMSTNWGFMSTNHSSGGLSSITAGCPSTSTGYICFYTRGVVPTRSGPVCQEQAAKEKPDISIFEKAGDGLDAKDRRQLCLESP